VATAAAKTHRRSKLHEEHEEHVNHERWLITYADMITLLMVLFIVLYSISQVDLAKFRRLKEGVAGGFGGTAAAGALSGGAGPLPGGAGVFDAGLHGTQAVTSAQAAQAALADAEARAAGARQQRAVLQGAQQEIQRSLARDGLGDTVKFRLEARGLVVTIVSDKVLFDPGQADLKPEGQDIVDKLAAVIGRLPNMLAVEGHTDNTPVELGAVDRPGDHGAAGADRPARNLPEPAPGRRVRRRTAGGRQRHAGGTVGQPPGRTRRPGRRGRRPERHRRRSVRWRRRRPATATRPRAARAARAARAGRSP
jgi:flagellar motor protein MotB